MVKHDFFVPLRSPRPNVPALKALKPKGEIVLESHFRHLSVARVFPPILESRDMSVRFETPSIKDTRTRGTAINFNRLIKMVPQGFIQSEVNCWKPNQTAKRPQATPKAIPTKI